VTSNGALVASVVPTATTASTGQLELTPETTTTIGASGERLTRDEAFDLVRRSVESLTNGDDAVRAGDVRRRARDLLGRDSESLSERNFSRIIRDAHDADVVDLRRRGDDFEVARAPRQLSVPDQLARSGPPPTLTPSAGTPALTLPGQRMGLGPRGTGPRGRAGRVGPPPPELLSVGIVPGIAPATPIVVPAATPAVEPPPEPTVEAPPTVAEVTAEPEAKRPARGTARRGRGRKQATKRPAVRGAATESGTPDLVLDVAPDAPVVDGAAASRKSGRAKAGAKARRGRKSPLRGGEE
jgi:hypothetical protein